jgi:zeta-carotene desaturase
MVGPIDRADRHVKRRVCIVGGGLAGIAAAVRLVEAEHHPIVIETRRKLGGRATSFIDPRTGETLDNCQHVVLGCCTNLIDLYQRIGVLELIRWDRTLYWCNGRRDQPFDRMEASWLPAPLHLGRSLRRMTLLNRNQKREIRRAMLRMIRMGTHARLSWIDHSFREFLDSCGQTEGTRRLFWEPIVVSACNLGIDRVAASTALHVFQEGFLGHRWSYTMGLSSAPLSDLYDPAVRLIEQAGGEILLGTSARAIAFDGRRVTGVVTDDGLVESAAVISAVPFDRLDKLASDTMKRADSRLLDLDRFQVSPILGVHLHFDQRVMDLPHLVLPGRETQWLFNKGSDERGRQHIHAVISAADAWMELTEAQIVDRVMSDVHEAIPRSIGLQPAEIRAVKEKRATFASLPGVDRIRPPVSAGSIGSSGGGIGNLFLAGDWCDTGWPATMEGAVRSGYAAAGAACGLDMMAGDMPVSPLARWLGLQR